MVKDMQKQLSDTYEPVLKQTKLSGHLLTRIKIPHTNTKLTISYKFVSYLPLCPYRLGEELHVSEL